MIYKLSFHPKAKREWDALASSIRGQLKKKLLERRDNPHVPADKMRQYKGLYKIKLRASGARLVYEVIEEKIVIRVIAVGIRDKIYDVLRKRQ